MHTFQHHYWVMQHHYVCTQTIISQEHVLTLSPDTFISHHHKSFIRLLIFPEVADLIIFRMTVSKDLFIRMDFNQSTTSVIQVVLWPPPLCLPLLRHHHASHWSVTILQCEPIRSVRAGYTSLLFKHSVPHAVLCYCCRSVLQSHACSSAF